MQVFDLTQLRTSRTAGDVHRDGATTTGVTNTHTISINQETGYAYLVGTTGTGGNPTCRPAAAICTS